MKYTTEQRKHTHCEVCGKDLGEKSKRPQWVTRVCFDCSQAANEIAIAKDLDFAQGVQELINSKHS